MPPEVWLRLTARSSTIRKMGLMVVDGVIDSGFRGELLVAVVNLSDRPRVVESGMRLAQVIPHERISDRLDIRPVESGAFNRLPQFDARGESGFGSSGRF